MLIITQKKIFNFGLGDIGFFQWLLGQDIPGAHDAVTLGFPDLLRGSQVKQLVCSGCKILIDLLGDRFLQSMEVLAGEVFGSAFLPFS